MSSAILLYRPEVEPLTSSLGAIMDNMQGGIELVEQRGMDELSVMGRMLSTFFFFSGLKVCPSIVIGTEMQWNWLFIVIDCILVVALFPNVDSLFVINSFLSISCPQKFPSWATLPAFQWTSIHLSFILPY